jgi:hypothetical protein
LNRICFFICIPVFVTNIIILLYSLDALFILFWIRIVTLPWFIYVVPLSNMIKNITRFCGLAIFQFLELMLSELSLSVDTKHVQTFLTEIIIQLISSNNRLLILSTNLEQLLFLFFFSFFMIKLVFVIFLIVLLWIAVFD